MLDAGRRGNCGVLDPSYLNESCPGENLAERILQEVMDVALAGEHYRSQVGKDRSLAVAITRQGRCLELIDSSSRYHQDGRHQYS